MLFHNKKKYEVLENINVVYLRENENKFHVLNIHLNIGNITPFELENRWINDQSYHTGHIQENNHNDIKNNENEKHQIKKEK